MSGEARKVELHKTDDTNKQIDVYALSRDQYVVEIPTTNDHGRKKWDLDFQVGVQPNGLTIKILLAIIVDRLQQVQRMELAAKGYADILGNLERQLNRLQGRTS